MSIIVLPMNELSSTMYGQRHTHQAGFSLIELITVIAVIGVLVAMAAPSIASTLERQRNKETANTIVAALKTARTESHLRRTDVTVAVSGNALTLTDGSASSTQIKSYTINDNTPIDISPSAAANVVFGANKKVNFGATGGSSTHATYKIYCTKDKSRAGREVKVDVHGNVSVETGSSQC